MVDEDKQFGEVPKGAIARLAQVPRKLQARGASWLLKRLREEGTATKSGILSLCAKARRYLIFKALEYEPTARRSSGSTLYAVYDLDFYPVSFDILWFLLWAESARRQRGFERLHCVFVPTDEDVREYPEGYDKVVDRVSRAWRFWNINVAATAFLKTNSGVTVCADRDHGDVLELISQNRFPSVKPMTGAPPTLGEMRQELMPELARQHGAWEGLRATEQGLRYVDQWLQRHAGGRKPVVITFRQYGVDPARNSNVPAWLEFAANLDSDTYCPIIVPDTDASLAGALDDEDVVVFDIASWNLGIRMALYERAYLNMSGSSGSSDLCILNPVARYVFLKVLVPSAKLASLETLEAMGFKKDTTPPFATPFQKWVWKDDTYDVITSEFNEMVALLEASSSDTQAAPDQSLGV